MSRLAVLVAVLVGFEMLLGRWVPSRIWGDRFVPNIAEIRDLGIILIWLGVGFAIWARYHLGEYWSARVTIKVDHKLIESGPYSYVRHPIYSGVLLGLIGTAFVGGQWRSLAAFLLILMFIFKARREERMLTAELGGTYQDYKNRTGMLIPRIG